MPSKMGPRDSQRSSAKLVKDKALRRFFSQALSGDKWVHGGNKSLKSEEWSPKNLKKLSKSRKQQFKKLAATPFTSRQDFCGFTEKEVVEGSEHINFDLGILARNYRLLQQKQMQAVDAVVKGIGGVIKVNSEASTGGEPQRCTKAYIHRLPTKAKVPKEGPQCQSVVNKTQITRSKPKGKSRHISPPGKTKGTMDVVPVPQPPGATLNYNKCTDHLPDTSSSLKNLVTGFSLQKHLLSTEVTSRNKDDIEENSSKMCLSNSRKRFTVVTIEGTFLVTFNPENPMGNGDNENDKITISSVKADGTREDPIYID